VITNWPGPIPNTNTTNEKVPSQIAYGTQFEGGFEWGNKIKSRTKREVWTKLLLDKTTKRDEMRLILELLTGNKTENKHLKSDDGKDDDDRPSTYPEKDPVKIVGDFLSGVRKHVMSCLETTYGKSLLREFEIELVVTVPAVWSDKAKNLTCQAVSMAGFDSDSIKLSMIAEPEAAAIYTLKSMKDSAFSDIKVNQQFNTFGEGNKCLHEMQPSENFIICDAGGGTVVSQHRYVRRFKF
jgi:hypothetical protein